jgi:formylglycine-generating enzyme required for sulfatase activity
LRDPVEKPAGSQPWPCLGIAAACLLLPSAPPRAAPAPIIAWPVAQYNPNTLPDDLILPLPCGGAMAFRPVATGKSPAGAAGLAPELQRLYGVVGRFDPYRTGIGHLLIGKYEVTRLQYQAVAAAARGLACPSPDARSALPQAEVNRRDAEGFGLDLSQWLDGRKDKLPDCTAGLTPCLPRVDGVAATVRLPGEDEWTFAARGGLAVSAADFAAPVYPMPKGLARTLIGKREGGSAAAPIGGPRANPLGLHDMLGNVEEIMLDLYRVEGATGEIGGYVVRGGSFYSVPGEIAVTLRREVLLLNKTSDTGFRVVAAVPIYTSTRRMAEVQQQGTGGPAPTLVPEPAPPVAPTPAIAEPQTGLPAGFREEQLALPEPPPAIAEAQTRLPFEPEMVEVPGGSFDMGCSPGDGQCIDNEKPVHPVSIRPFRMGRYEVTQAQWQAVMGENPARFRGAERPVEQVSWDDAQAYIKALNTKASPAKPYRLATEAEWEYAARAGTRTPYWWGQEIGTGNANCYNCGSRWDDKETAPVGSFKPNAFGLYDTTGNVWEWVQDCYHERYAGAPSGGSEWRDDCLSAGRVLRGGSWYNLAWYTRVSHRFRLTPAYRGGRLGLRLAQDL